MATMTGKELQDAFCRFRGVCSNWDADESIDKSAWNRLAEELAIPVRVEPDETPRPCLFCGAMLEPATADGWEHFQPYRGGEVQFIFSYGSTKFDNHMGTTVFRALVCDDCGEKYVPQMTPQPASGGA